MFVAGVAHHARIVVHDLIYTFIVHGEQQEQGGDDVFGAEAG